MRSLSFNEFVTYMGGGNHKAVLIIGEMLEADPMRAVPVLNTLDDLDIRGANLVRAYEACHQSIAELFREIERGKLSLHNIEATK